VRRVKLTNFLSCRGIEVIAPPTALKLASCNSDLSSRVRQNVSAGTLRRRDVAPDR